MIEHKQSILHPTEVRNAHISKTERLTSLLKWAGGKEKELKHILPLIPPFNGYYEPFVGGGAVLFAIQSPHKFINDKSPDLINFYKMTAEKNKEFFQALDILLYNWQNISRIVDRSIIDLIASYKAYSANESSLGETQDKLFTFIQSHDREFRTMFEVFFSQDAENFIQELQKNLISKTRRMKQLENKKWELPECDIIANMESALKSSFYMHLRHLYNRIDKYRISPGLAAAIFFFVRENAYASMFRYNKQGNFNVPYGGLSYNRKDLARKIAYLQSAEVEYHLKNTVVENMDFEGFLLKHAPREEDFVFLDPPYDSKFSTYAQNTFEQRDQERLAGYLLHHCKAKFMLVIKNTTFIRQLYNDTNLHIKVFDKKYLVSFQDRNDKNAEHLIITNY